jgi:hypothetical protein
VLAVLAVKNLDGRTAADAGAGGGTFSFSITGVDGWGLVISEVLKILKTLRCLLVLGARRRLRHLEGSRRHQQCWEHYKYGVAYFSSRRRIAMLEVSGA